MNIRTLNPALSTLALSLLSGLALLAPAVPAAADSPRSITVSFRDLDISSTAGAHTLYTRIKVAARDLCGTEGHSLTEIAHYQRCVQATVDDAVSRVNSPLLTALHTGTAAATATAMLGK